jgi:flagellar hook-basal body complex protein FliE
VSIDAIGPISGIFNPALSAAKPAGGASADGFAAQLSQGLEQLQQSQTKADDLAVKAATGDLTDAHDYMVASTEAALTMQLTTAVRNKALDAFNEIMRLQG